MKNCCCMYKCIFLCDCLRAFIYWLHSSARRPSAIPAPLSLSTVCTPPPWTQTATIELIRPAHSEPPNSKVLYLRRAQQQPTTPLLISIRSERPIGKSYVPERKEDVHTKKNETRLDGGRVALIHVFVREIAFWLDCDWHVAGRGACSPRRELWTLDAKRNNKPVWGRNHFSLQASIMHARLLHNEADNFL